MTQKFRQKFIKEAQNISRLNHPNIIKVLDVFEENGTAYYVMEYINGGSLSEMIKQNGNLSEDETLYYTRKIASALQYIHSKKMNHLDVKPANVLLRQDGDVVLIDFGLSKNYDAAGEQTTSTPVGISVGYAPIEQSRVGGVGMFSPATDIYSLGATMFKMLTGQTPPEASAIFDDGLPEMPSTASDLIKRVITKSMEPRRKERYQSIEEMLKALSNLVTETNIVTAGLNLSENAKTKILPEEISQMPRSTIEEPVIHENEEEATIILDNHTDDIVDLGLSVKWCSGNVGSSESNSLGSYFTIEAFKNYFPKGNLRFPTKEEWKELLTNCSMDWENDTTVKLIGPNGKYIKIPIAGRIVEGEHIQVGEIGYYWASFNRNEGKLWFARLTKSDSSANNVIAKTKTDIAMSIRLIQTK